MKTQKNHSQKVHALKGEKRKVLLTLAILLLALIFIASHAFAQTPMTKSTPGEMVGALNAAFGKHPHARAVHAKGIIMEGTFKAVPQAAELSSAPHFSGKVIPVIFRFSDFTGIPDIPDTVGASSPRGLALKFKLPGGGSTDIVSHSFNGFPVATTDEFREFLLAISKSGPQSPQPKPLDQFLSSHPIAKTFLQSQKPLSVSYATLDYFGVNAFKFTNRQNKSVFIRYQFLPVDGEEFLTDNQRQSAEPDYLGKEIRNRLVKGPVKYKMFAQISQDGDQIENPAIAWPESRKLVLLGILTISRITENTDEQDRRLIFNPGNLPSGIEIADQMLLDRQKAYPVSAAQRNQ
ncbi:catalase family peroxidase [Pedobacter miscanthi]|uniref:catalase family peroxidase n=1 Tax=Pedobacter miscanthi TaxID=2259170 RepID=UPI001ABEF2BE|nr:catalase family peroxidase [Pedobacter miscanthi]